MLHSNLIHGERLLRVARPVRGDLRRPSAPPSLFFQPRFDRIHPSKATLFSDLIAC